MELRCQISKTFLCGPHWNVDRAAMDQDDERVAATLARIQDDDRSPTGCTLEIGEEGGKEETEETGLHANLSNKSLHFKVEMAHPFMLICSS